MAQRGHCFDCSDAQRRKVSFLTFWQMSYRYIMQIIRTPLIPDGDENKHKVVSCKLKTEDKQIKIQSSRLTNSFDCLHL